MLRWLAAGLTLVTAALELGKASKCHRPQFRNNGGLIDVGNEKVAATF